MKKIILVVVISIMVFSACDNIPNDIIDSDDPDFRVIEFNAPSEIIQTSTESNFVTSIKFENTSTISSVWFNIVTDDGTASIKQNVVMRDDGGSASGDNNASDGTYTGQTVFDESVPSGKYVVEYYLENNVRTGADKTQLVASHSFFFISNSENFPPIISNPVVPDTVIIQSPNTAVDLHLQAEDVNGLTDLKNVYFYLYEPSSADSIKISMADDGNTEVSGDVTAGDGIYSKRYLFTPSHKRGEYKLVFQAEDNLGQKSNKETRYIFATDNNEPPQVSNLIMPDSIKLDDPFEFSIEAKDPNGLVDINRVYYELYRPDGTLVENSQGISKFPLSDNGDTDETGDLTAGDAIFTMKLMFPAGQQVGEWRFEFTAEDNTGLLSNKIIHVLTVE